MNYSCHAKGSEISFWLHSGLIASCCKGTPVAISDTAISSLLNHPVIQQQKAALDAGIPDASCNYCWQAEKNNQKSMRYYKNKNSLHKLVELAFDNTCNFTCLYCGPKFSSRWQNITPEKTNSILKQIDVIDLISALEADNFQELRILGGEPFLSKNFLKFIDNYQFKPDMLYTVVSNLCPDTSNIWDRFFHKTKNCRIRIYVSLDTGLDTAKQIRLGFDTQLFQDNLHKLYDLHQVFELHFLNTINCLTIFDRLEFDRFIQEQRSKTNKLITVDNNYLEFPSYLNINILDQEACDLLDINCLSFPNKKLHQIKLVKFLIDMEKHSGVPLSYYNNLTCGFIQRIVTEYGIDTDRLY